MAALNTKKTQLVSFTSKLSILLINSPHFHIPKIVVAGGTFCSLLSHNAAHPVLHAPTILVWREMNETESFLGRWNPRYKNFHLPIATNRPAKTRFQIFCYLHNRRRRQILDQRKSRCKRIVQHNKIRTEMKSVHSFISTEWKNKIKNDERPTRIRFSIHTNLFVRNL